MFGKKTSWTLKVAPFSSQSPLRVTFDLSPSRNPQMVLTGWSFMLACRTIPFLKILGRCSPEQTPLKRIIKKNFILLGRLSSRHYAKFHNVRTLPSRRILVLVKETLVWDGNLTKPKSRMSLDHCYIPHSFVNSQNKRMTFCLV